MLADNSKNCIVDARFKLTNQLTSLPIRKFLSNEIDFSSSDRFIIGHIRGSWAGHIIERPIEGANFALISQNQIILKKGSALADDIRGFLQEGLNYKVCEIINFLQESTQGFAHPSIEKYL